MPHPINLDSFEKIFYGKCHAIALDHRGLEDKHVVMQILSEDDGNWFIGKRDFSSYWCDELISLLHEAKDWMNKNCIADEEGYGWSFR
jgi:hypothetical protein